MRSKHYQVSVALTAAQHEQIKKHLFPGDGCEAVAILICGRSTYKSTSTLLVNELFKIPYESCRVRKPDRVTWNPDVIVPALEKAMNKGLSIIKIHSHPSDYRKFSDTDDISDKELFSSIYGWLDIDEPMASLIMMPNGELIGRSIFPNGLGNPLRSIRVVGDDIKYWFSEDTKPDIPAHAVRIVQAFGDGTYSVTRRLHAGVVGCSGTGSIIIEQSARNHIGQLTIVDPKTIGHKNLNRILNSTWEHAEKQTAKVEVLAVAIKAMNLGTQVNTYESDLISVEVIKKLSQCDVIFGCMDSVDGRHILNKIASYYLIPYIDMGVRIEADGKGGIESINGAIHYIRPGGSSLLSRGVYTQADLEAAMMKRHTPELYEERAKQGYVRGVRVDEPAVISINMQIASMAFNEFLARVNPYRIEPNSKYAQRRVVISDPEASMDMDDGKVCQVFKKWVGLGDQQTLLGIQDLQNDKK